MGLRTKHTPITEPFTQQINYTLENEKLTITIAVVPQPDGKPPLVYVSNENYRVHDRPRCIRISTVPYLSRTYFYDRARIYSRGEKKYEMDIHVVETVPQTPIRPEHYLENAPAPTEPEEPRWSIHARLLETCEIYPDGASHYGTISEDDQ